MVIAHPDRLHPWWFPLHCQAADFMVRSVALWMARQFDHGVTLAGTLIALLLMGTAIGALIGLASGSMLLATLFGVPLLLLLGLFFLAAHHTDPTLRMSEQEKRDRWEKMPTFAKWSLYISAVGALVGVLLGGRMGHSISWALIAISMLLFAEGVRRERPPLPRSGKRERLTETESPSEYQRLWKQTLWSFYLCGAGFALLALLPLR